MSNKSREPKQAFLVIATLIGTAFFGLKTYFQYGKLSEVHMIAILISVIVAPVITILTIRYTKKMKAEGTVKIKK